MVDQADLLLAVCDPASARSGSAATLRYARSLARPILHIDPITRAVTRED